jgi:ubiquinone biosynthesis monooxygenase Coq7
MTPGPRRPLPGDPSYDRRMARMIRVDHAGEYGAKRIYEGQLAVLGRTDKGPVLRHMAEQERVHLETFERLIAERGVRPTLLRPLWHVAGFAVEEVIDEHYARQAEGLGPQDQPLQGTVERFRQEELEHRDIGLAHEAEKAPAYEFLSAAIKAGSRAAIWISERV